MAEFFQNILKNGRTFQNFLELSGISKSSSNILETFRTFEIYLWKTLGKFWNIIAVQKNLILEFWIRNHQRETFLDLKSIKPDVHFCVQLKNSFIKEFQVFTDGNSQHKKGFRIFWNILERSEIFYNILGPLKNFSNILETSV